MFHYAYTLRHVFTSLTEYKEYRPEPLRSYFYEHLVPGSRAVAEGFVVIQSLSHVRLFVIPCTAPCQASLSFTISQSLLKFLCIKSVKPSKHLTFCCPLLLLPSIFPGVRVFSSESALSIRWTKNCSFSFSISSSKEYSGLISFRIDWFNYI